MDNFLCGEALSRRRFLAGAATFAAWAHVPHVASAAGSGDKRLITIILRGAMDGLATVVPTGDPALYNVRRETALPGTEAGDPLKLDGFFGLNPTMPNLHRLYMKGEASFVHAVATPYRERSHFDGQDLLESGYPNVARVDSGWMNRAVLNLRQGEAVNTKGFSVGATPPLIFKGKAPVTSWSPVRERDIADDTLQRLLAVYSDQDDDLRRALQLHMENDGDMSAGSMAKAGGNGLTRNWVTAAEGAARFMAADDGPRLGVLSFDGWDTHANQGPVKGRLGRSLHALDESLAALEKGLGKAWRETVVTIVTEFGRTVAENGTDGTDHGTATVAILAGGAVNGKRIIADWPGLKQSQLYEGRDLRPTRDLRSVFKGVLLDHMGLSSRVLANDIFPESVSVTPLKDLIRA